MLATSEIVVPSTVSVPFDAPELADEGYVMRAAPAAIEETDPEGVMFAYHFAKGADRRPVVLISLCRLMDELKPDWPHRMSRMDRLVEVVLVHAWMNFWDATYYAAPDAYFSYTEAGALAVARGKRIVIFERTS